MKTYVLLFLVLGIHTDKGDAVECNRTLVFNETSKTIEYTINGTCTIVISRNSSTDTFLKINKVTLTDNDTLVIYDGNQNINSTIAKYSAKSTVGYQVYVGFQKNVTIVFTTSGNKSQSAISLSYNTAECNFTMDNNKWLSRLDAPLYVPTHAKEIYCTHVINSSAVPAFFTTVASLSSFQLSRNSSLIIKSPSGSIIYTNSTQNDFFADGTNELAVELNITDTNMLQTFSLMFGTVVKECSRTVTLSSLQRSYRWTFSLIDTPGYECRLLLQTNNSFIVAHLSSLDIVPGHDSLTFINGGSSSGVVLATLTTDVKDDYLVISSSESVVVSLVLGNSLEQRSIDLTFTEAVIGGHFDDAKYLEFQNKTDNFTVYYQLIAKEDQVVQVEVLSDIPKDSTVTFYNGLQMSDSKLAVFRHGHRNLNSVIGNSHMLVELSDFDNGSSFTANFSSTLPGCNKLATSPTGQLAYSGDSDESCTWIVAPLDDKGTIILNIDSLYLSEEVSLDVYSGLENKSHLSYFSGPLMNTITLPQIYINVSEGVSIVITRRAVNKAATVDLHYRTVSDECGGILTDVIATPNYPNQYPLNAHCLWHKNVSGHYHFLSFQDLDLVQNHTVSLVTVINETSQVFQTYGVNESRELPGDLVVSGATDVRIEFQSSNSLGENINQVGRGFNITSRLLDCGGMYYDNGSFEFGYREKISQPSFCVWIVNVKGKHDNTMTNIVNFTIDAVDRHVIDKYVKIYDGNSVRTKLVINIKEQRHILSRYDTVVVLLNYTLDEKVEAGIRFNFTTKICQADELCDNGVCLHEDWRCNHIDDCGDNTDERNCSFPTPTPQPHTQDYSGWVKSGWIPACLFIGILLGAVAVFAGPKIIHRLRTRGGSYSRMGDNTSTA